MQGQQDSYKRLNDFRETEIIISGLREAIRLEKSLCEKAVLYNKLITLLLRYGDKEFFTANFSEFTDDFTSSVELYPVQGRDPAESETFLRKAEQIIYFFPGLNEGRLPQITEEKLLQLNKLNDTLQGDSAPSEKLRTVLYFPVIEQKDNLRICSYLETINIRIIGSDKPTSFLIYPGENTTDPRLKKQVETAFSTAQKLALRGRKNDSKRYEVIVTFVNSRAEYTGDSFGLLLTLQFYLELSRIYYPALNLRPAVNMSLTGGIDENGKVIKIGTELINTKLEAAALSDSEIFIIPREDHRQLGFPEYYSPEKYPDRQIKIIGVSCAEDILNRRDLIVIEKKPVRRRIAEFTLRHAAAIIAIILLVLVSSLYLYSTYDDNPAGYRVNGNKFHILNKSGRVLWSGEQTVDLDYELKFTTIDRIIRIFDSDNDGENEVLIAQMKSDKSAGIYAEIGAVLFNKKGEVIWQFQFSDSVYSYREGYMEKVYGSDIMDITDQDGKKIVYLVNNNAPSFTSAIIRLDAATGIRLPGTLWHPGHILRGKVFNTSEGSKLLAIAHNNGYEKVTAFVVPAEIKDGQILPTEAYRLRGVNPVLPEIYLRFPLNDYEEYRNYRQPFFLYSRYAERGENIFDINTRNPENPGQGFLLFWLNAVTGEVSVFVDSAFRYLRDSLVSAGILNPPLTDTKEYTDAIRDSIDYYFDGRWIKYQEYHRLRKEGKLR